jgi:peptidoglycan hydrolase CwlO-like protein
MTFDEHADFILQSIASHDRQIGELHEAIGRISEDIGRISEDIDKLGANMRELQVAVDKTTANVDKLVSVSNQDGINIQALARIAASHEQRIAKMEEAR